MNQKIATAAQEAMVDPTIESGKGYCSKYVRQVFAKVYGSKYASLFGPSAIATCHLFLAKGYAKKKSQMLPLQVGDVLFKTIGSGEFGHVGIYTGLGISTGEGKVAENSSTSIGRINGAKGYRSLSQFGNYQYIGRITDK